MSHSTTRLFRAVCALALAGSAAAAHAEMSNAAFNTAKDQLKSAYKVERDACSSMTANAKDICVETAKGRESVALAHLQMQRTGNAKDASKFASARNDARYGVAKEKCDDLSGNAKDVCVKEAKAQHEKVKADIKLNKEVREARNDAEETKMKADYKVAAERCESLKGDSKSACVATAKARFGM